MEIAVRWRDARTEVDRQNVFDEHGIRWSELLRLPYWDPTRYAVVDAMHNLFLGELRHHCMEVWGIDILVSSGEDGKVSRHIVCYGRGPECGIPGPCRGFENNNLPKRLDRYLPTEDENLPINQDASAPACEKPQGGTEHNFSPVNLWNLKNQKCSFGFFS